MIRTRAGPKTDLPPTRNGEFNFFCSRPFSTDKSNYAKLIDAENNNKQSNELTFRNSVPHTGRRRMESYYEISRPGRGAAIGHVGGDKCLCSDNDSNDSIKINIV